MTIKLNYQNIIPAIKKEKIIEKVTYFTFNKVGQAMYLIVRFDTEKGYQNSYHFNLSYIDQIDIEGE